MRITKRHISNFFIALLWCAAGAGSITLLAAAAKKKDRAVCRGVQINIQGVTKNFFIDEHDVYSVIERYGGDSSSKRTSANVDLRKIEAGLEKEVWIKNAELYFDNNNILMVSVEEREPVARIFTAGGLSYYVDSSAAILPLSEKLSARLPVFTGFPTDAKILNKADSLLMKQIVSVSLKIEADSFLHAMIEQVDIMPNRHFEMIPKIGNQLIVFGDGLDADAKFRKLKMFYKEVITKAGWNRYRKIDLQFRDQVVASIRGKEDVAYDSLRTMALLKQISDEAARRSADSIQTILPDSRANNIDSTLMQQSVERDESGFTIDTNTNNINTTQNRQP